MSRPSGSPKGVLSTVLVVMTMLTMATGAQERRQVSGGPAPYDAANETTVRGTARTMAAIEGGSRLMILTADVKGAPIRLILAPEAYLKAQSFTVAAGVALEITGVAGHQVEGEPAMLVRQIKAGERTLTVRDETGRPAWLQEAGAGTRRQP